MTKFRTTVDAAYLVKAGPVIDIKTGKRVLKPMPPPKISSKKPQKPTEQMDDDDAERFLKGWYESEGFSDFNLAMDRGYLEYAAWILKGAGVFEDESEKTNHQILYWLKDYTAAKAKKDVDDMLKNTEIWVNEHNETAFVPSGDVDYYMSKKDMEGMGYKFEHGYDRSGKEFKKSKLT